MTTALCPDSLRTENSVVADGFATIPEAAGFLKISRSAVYGLMYAGQLRYARFGRSRRIPWSALVAFAEQATQSNVN